MARNEEGGMGCDVKPRIHWTVAREQLVETLGVCVYMGGGPSLMYAGEAVRAYEEFTAPN